jgi:hypothetical protein
MDTICTNDIKMLLQSGAGMHVSMVMPTHHKGGVDQQDLIRYKNLLRSAEEKLVLKGLRPAEARLMLKPAESLLTDSLFWRQQGDGLALFLESNRYFYYRLPLVLEAEVEVGPRFFIRPLISLLGKCGLFYILAVSQNENRLLQCSLNGTVRLNNPDIPASMAEVLQLENTPEPSIRFHASSTAGNAGSGAAIQSAASSKANIDKDHILQYFEQLNRGVLKALKLEQSALVLAGVDYLHPIYRKVNTYPHLLAEGITGNPDVTGDAALREQAWPIVNSYFDKDRLAALAEYRQAAGTGVTVDRKEEVVTASGEGRTRFLFIAEGIQYRGQITPETGEEDLIDYAVYQTLKHAGAVYVLKPEDMPGKAGLLALLRY